MPTEKTLKMGYQYWVPPILTAVIGFFGGLSLPLLQDVLSTDRFFLEQRVRAADTVGNEFSRYVENWRRLVAMKKYGIILADNGSAWYISGAPDACAYSELWWMALKSRLAPAAMTSR